MDDQKARRIRRELKRLAGELDLLDIHGNPVLGEPGAKSDGEEMHVYSATAQATERRLLNRIERGTVYYFLPLLLSGYAATTVLDDLGSAFVVALLGGASGAGLTRIALALFQRLGWKRRYAYVAALVLFLGLLTPIILVGDGLGPYVARSVAHALEIR